MRVSAAAASLQVEVLESFEDPALDAARWDRLLGVQAGSVFMSHAWQRLWWRTKGGAHSPAIVLAESAGELVAIAPLFAADGIVMLVGSGNADQLDFVGAPDERTLAAMLAAVRERVGGFAGVELYHLPDSSPTRAMLPGVAARLALDLHGEHEEGAPYADLTDAGLLERLTARRSVRKEEARMARAGELAVRRAQPGEARALVELFFRQHAARWEAEGKKSFDLPGSRELVHAAVEQGLREGWVRLTALDWDGSPAALDISLVRGSTQLSWLVSRDPSIRDYSPGRVLRAHVIRDAFEAGVSRFDFGLGEEGYKLADCSGVGAITNWFMYT